MSPKCFIYHQKHLKLKIAWRKFLSIIKVIINFARLKIYVTLLDDSLTRPRESCACNLPRFPAHFNHFKIWHILATFPRFSSKSKQTTETEFGLYTSSVTAIYAFLFSTFAEVERLFSYYNIFRG